MEHIFIDLLNISITAGYMVLAILLLRPLLSKAPKFVRCLLWALVGLRLAFPFSIESILSLIPSAQTVPQEILYSSQPAIHSGIAFMNSAINPVLSGSLAPTPGDSVNPMQVVMAVAANVWILGMIVMAVYAAISYFRLRHKLKEAVHEGNHIWLCDHIGSAFLLGLFRPRIYLPSALAEQDKPYVVAHEKAHLQRRDHWWKPLGYLLLTVYWFNPLMWVAYILLCRDIEFACDEKVIRQLGTDCKRSYSEALINCSVSKKSISACPVAFGEDGVKGRIQSILNYKKPAFWIILIAIIVCIAVAVCFLTVPPEAPSATPSVSYSFSAYILEVNEDSLLVKPLENEDELSVSDQFIIMLPDGTEDYSQGRIVDIFYDGQIEELYPAIIPNVSSVFLRPLTYDFVDSSLRILSVDFDIDQDGIAETFCVDYGPTSGIASYDLYALENGVLEYHNVWIPMDHFSISYQISDGQLLLVTHKTTDSQELELVTYRVTVQDNQIALNGSVQNLWGGSLFSPPVLSQLRENYPQFLNLTTDKGLEVYVWKNGDWRCGVRSGTNRNATTEELWAFGDGASLEEMAVILSTYPVTMEEISILYNYHPAFSGPYEVVPGDGEQAYIEKILFQFMNYWAAPKDYPDRYVPQEDLEYFEQRLQYLTGNYYFAATEQHPLVIYAFQLAEKAWCFQFIENTTITRTTLQLMNYPHCNLETALEKLESYNIPPEKIPVVVYQNPISSYIGTDTLEEQIQNVRVMLGLG